MSTTTTTTQYDLKVEGTTAQLVYQKPLPEGVVASVNINSNNKDGTPESNFEEEKHTVHLHNIRNLSPDQYVVDVTFDRAHPRALKATTEMSSSSPYAAWIAVTARRM